MMIDEILADLLQPAVGHQVCTDPPADQQHHRRRAPDDAEHRQRRPPAVQPHGVEGLADDLEKHREAYLVHSPVEAFRVVPIRLRSMRVLLVVELCSMQAILRG